MITIHEKGGYLIGGKNVIPAGGGMDAKLAALSPKVPAPEEARKGTITWGILERHNHSGNMNQLSLVCDCLASHDITFVNIIQTAKASGMTRFPMPFVLTNCHNSLCAVGGTINEDDHIFGLSAAKKYGGVYVPPHLAVMHTYLREMYAGCGSVIMGSDSHTRYGAVGTMGFGEGGGELVKQLLGKTYDIRYPGVVGVVLKGKLKPGVGPHDVVLALIAAVFDSGLVKNKVLEFVGDGIASLSMDTRNGIDTMTTETACLSSIWKTDTHTETFLRQHGRPEAFRCLEPADVAFYDVMIEIDLAGIEPMIALPFHPSNAFPINVVRDNLADIIHKVEQDAVKLIGNRGFKYDLSRNIADGKLRFDQATIAGCAGGTFENLFRVGECLRGTNIGREHFSLAVYPSSQPVALALSKEGVLNALMLSGATIRTAFCGPCFGAGDVPANGTFAVRHTTRNFPNREGSQPAKGQMAYTALMDARSIAVTARNGGILTPGTEAEWDESVPDYAFTSEIYAGRVYNGFGNPHPEQELIYGPNIVDWPEISPLAEHLLLGVASVITDPVTTTDELIPSGDTSSYRSNPIAMAEFTLSRKDPSYVGNAKRYQAMERIRLEGKNPAENEKGLASALEAIHAIKGYEQTNFDAIGLGSVLYAHRPGDGSAREQAASCQRMLGGCANVAHEYATKRYRSNLLNWGMLPFLMADGPDMAVGDYLFIPDIRQAILKKAEVIDAYIIGGGKSKLKKLSLGELTDEERKILLEGCLMNYYRHAK